MKHFSCSHWLLCGWLGLLMTAEVVIRLFCQQELFKSCGDTFDKSLWWGWAASQYDEDTFKDDFTTFLAYGECLSHSPPIHIYCNPLGHKDTCSSPMSPCSFIMAITNDDKAPAHPLTLLQLLLMSSSIPLLPLCCTAFLKCPKDGTPGKSDGKTCVCMCVGVCVCVVEHKKVKTYSMSVSFCQQSQAPRFHPFSLHLFLSLSPQVVVSYVELHGLYMCMNFLLL